MASDTGSGSSSVELHEAHTNSVNLVTSKPSKQASLIELAGTITRETEKLEKYLRDNEYQMPGFDVASPLNFPTLPKEIQRAREEVARASKELADLVTGPTEIIRWMAWDHNNSLSLRAIYHYGIAKSFPLNETATYAQISQAVGLDEVNVRRFMRYAMTNRIFQEVSPSVVAHTAASRVLVEDKPMDDWVGFCVEDLWPASCQTIPALILYPTSSEPTQTGFCLANNTTNKEPMFTTLGRSPLRAKRMGGAMASFTSGEGYETHHLLDNYDWASIDARGGTVVDLGGSHGFVCVALAQRWKNMRFVVQDLPKTIASAPKLEPDEIAARIVFQAHDFNTEQPVKGADVYLYRWILHNHSTPYAINMLRQLIPALKPGSRILINDYCLHDPSITSTNTNSNNTTTSAGDKTMRSMDLIMLTLLNSQERTEEEFRALFESADKRFAFKGVVRPEGCRMSIVEAVWEGQEIGSGGESASGSGEEVVDSVRI